MYNGVLYLDSHTGAKAMHSLISHIYERRVLPSVYMLFIARRRKQFFSLFLGSQAI